MIKVKVQSLIITVFIAFAMTACSHGQDNQKADNDEISDSMEKVLTAAPVTMKPMSEELVLNGTVDVDESKLGKVFIPCSGKVSGIRAEVGDYVRRGQLLGIVHSTDAANWHKETSQADANIRVAERDYKMKMDMQKSGMASSRDVEEAKAALLVARAERQRLQQVAGIDGFANKSNASLVAPISGFVITKNVYNDSYIDDTNNDDPAFEIADISSVWVIGSVYESDIAKVHQGQHVYVTTASYPDKTYSGTIDRVYSVLDNESRTMKVRVRLQNPGGLLKPGLFASIHVELPTKNSTMPVVPASSMVFENGNQYVVVRDGRRKYHVQQVSVAHATDRLAYIERGIDVGDNVVTNNALLIYNALTNE